MKKTCLVGIFGFLMLVLACGSSTEDRGESGPGPKNPKPIVVNGPVPVETSLQCPKGTYLSYENFGAAFLSTYCLSCHSRKLPESQRGNAPLAANFDTVADASLYRALMLAKTQGATPTMPPAQAIPVVQKEAFAEWLNCGAPSSNSR